MTSMPTFLSPKANPAQTDMTLRSPDRNPDERDLFFRPYSKTEQVGRKIDEHGQARTKTAKKRFTHKNSRKGLIEKRMKAYRVKIKWCERCLTNGETVTATETHHIHPVGMGGARPDDPLHQEDNFSALCLLCHRWADAHTSESIPILELIKGQSFENLAKALSLTRVTSRFEKNGNH
jgi:hypothetical protein